jgi:hypothetical protein
MYLYRDRYVYISKNNCVGYSSADIEEKHSLQLNKWKNMCIKHKDICMCEYVKIVEYIYIYTYNV